MKSDKPRRVFVSKGDEMAYLFAKVDYWKTIGVKSKRFRHFFERFRRLVSEVPRKQKSIQAQKYWSLVFEIQGKYRHAIAHKKAEISLITLYLSKYAPEPPVDHKYLALEYISLGWLFYESGLLTEAKRAIQKAKKVKKEHGFSLGRIGLESLLTSQAAP
jgi:tetratricopeptide (TPR) repeat protein